MMGRNDLDLVESLIFPLNSVGTSIWGNQSARNSVFFLFFFCIFFRKKVEEPNVNEIRIRADKKSKGNKISSPSLGH